MHSPSRPMAPCASLFLLVLGLAASIPASPSLPPAAGPKTSGTSLAEAASPPARADRVPKVLILGLDGLRADAFLSVKPRNLGGLIRRGAFAPDARADLVTRSGPGWTSIFTGVSSDRHGVVDNTFAGYRAASHPSFFRRIKEARPSMVLASAVAWGPLQEPLLSDGDIAWSLPNDAAVAWEGVRLLSGAEDGRDPDLIFLHFDAPDYAGHRWGFSRFSPPYRAAIRRTDKHIGRLLAALERRPDRDREDWLILVVTDHGGSLRHHGEDIPECRYVPLIAVGDGIPAGAILQGTALTDVMPTVLAWLGVEAKKEWALEGVALQGPREGPGGRAVLGDNRKAPGDG